MLAPILLTRTYMKKIDEMRNDINEFRQFVFDEEDKLFENNLDA